MRRVEEEDTETQQLDEDTEGPEMKGGCWRRTRVLEEEEDMGASRGCLVQLGTAVSTDLPAWLFISGF